MPLAWVWLMIFFTWASIAAPLGMVCAMDAAGRQSKANSNFFVIKLSDALEVGSDIPGEESGKTVPDRRHSDGHREGSAGKDEWSGPGCRPVNAMERNEIINEHEQDQDAKAGDRAGGRRDAQPAPGKTAKCGFDQAYGGKQDQAFVSIRFSASAPGSKDYDGKRRDPDQRDGRRDGWIERTDHHFAAQGID